MATESSSVQPSVPKFNGHYDHWAMLMENFLQSKEYWGVIENGLPAAVAERVTVTDAQKKIYVERKLKDLKAKNYLFQELVHSILETIINKDTSKNIWDSMKQKYQGTMWSNLLVHEQRMSNTVEEKHALKVTHRGNYSGRGRGCGSYESRGLGRSTQSLDKATIECYSCNKLGHFQWECPMKGAAKFAKSQTESQEHMLLMAYVEEGEQHKTDIWFLDSGCSNHMGRKKEYFSDFDDKFTESVKLGNNANMVVNGKGNIRPALAVKDKTPEEAWSRVNEESKAYRLYAPVLERIIVSRDVVFEENEKWEWEKQYEAEKFRELEWEDSATNIAQESTREGADVADVKSMQYLTINEETSPGCGDGRNRK
ncbi:hypothetical protein Salat_2526800 [Sesamum alatum]|uniref:CCHC-type domain-containing protein n=1 Tax=Sesamum alatum TaxID=300844 RepID=A0AAE1XSZ4_9LAMI|nr:hypothetical protein Salat_2526800 [Sesamum alatum]